MQDCYQVIEECTLFEREAYLNRDRKVQEMHLEDISELHRLINARCELAKCLKGPFYDTWAAKCRW